ncbi:MAG: EAL domain-containing protein [Burkholderiales bacterium]|nr:EAL domain-containing protein [Burkholderiales bacterium]
MKTPPRYTAARMAGRGGASSSAAVLRFPSGAQAISLTEAAGAGGHRQGGTLPAILVVDDNPDILDIYRKILTGDDAVSTQALSALEASIFREDAGPEIAHIAHIAHIVFPLDLVQDGRQACGMAQQARRDGRPYAVAFVDMRMPGGWDGLETIENLWRVDPDIEVVICTAYTDYTLDETMARLACPDRFLILNKPFEKIEVLQLACALSEKWRLQRARQTRLDELERRVEERTLQLQEALGNVRHQASHDSLTGLPNRVLFMDLLRQAVACAKCRGGRIVTAFIDLDRFKWINDSLGHHIGDELLKLAARRMCACLRDTDTVARIGGDEFVLLLPDGGSAEESMRIVARLLAAVAQPMTLAGRQVTVGCSVGCSTYPEDGDDADALLRFADAAMYRAKEAGGGKVQLYNVELSERIEQRVLIETELRRALERGQLALHYQPQVDLRSGRIDGVEALLRWRHPELGEIGPARFIPVAEEMGLIAALGEWVLRQACAQGKLWQDAVATPVRVAVNVSAKQLDCSGFPFLVAQCLSDSGLAPERLEIELTESAAMENPDKTVLLMHRLKELGVSLSIDDFGTGYSNMNYMKQFPMDRLKLDGSFVRGITTDPKSLAIVDAIIAMSHRLGLKVVAEMAETEGQVVCLANRHCDQVQGYYFSRALPADACSKLLHSGALPLPAQIAGAGQERVLLVVDDEAQVVSALQRELRPQTDRLLCAERVDEALELLARHPVGVILSDLRMPQSNGMELLNKVRLMYPHIVRLILSGEQSFESVRSAVNRGAAHKFLVKPWDGRELKDILNEAFDLHERLLLEGARPARL